MAFVVPILPTNSTNKVINKTVVYSDTVLPLKEKGQNLKVTSISNVDNSELERCLETVFDNNSNITFNTLQYSRKDKKVYFYTDKEINTKCWDEANAIAYDYADFSHILSNIDDILNQPVNTDESVASVYLVSKLNRDFYEKSKQKKEFLNQKLENALQLKMGNSCRSYISSYHTYDGNDELEIRFSKYGQEYKSIVFSKENDDIYVLRSESSYGLEILENAYSVLNEIMNYYESINKHHSYCKSNNSPLSVNIDYYETSISDYRMPIFANFAIGQSNREEGVYVRCNSSKVLEKLKGKETELLRKVFVKISDCPEVLKNNLNQLRVKEIKYNLRHDKKENKKQQRKEKIEKIFPFVKKR